MTCDVLPCDEAQGLLAAWESRDTGLLSLELDRILGLQPGSPGCSETQRLQLLQAIAEQMKSRPDEARPHLWLGLLNYLANDRRKIRFGPISFS
jgi:hypothetical protein